MKQAAQSTNTWLIRLGKLFPYASQLALFRCPSDVSQTGGMARVRSYSMNSWMGSRLMEQSPRNGGYRTFVRDSELAAAGPARLWLFIDEHERGIDDGWFLVTMDDSQPFASAPAQRHSQGYGLSFADGHVELYRLRDPGSATLGSGAVQASPANADWLRLKQVTTVR